MIAFPLPEQATVERHHYSTWMSVTNKHDGMPRTEHAAWQPSLQRRPRLAHLHRQRTWEFESRVIVDISRWIRESTGVQEMTVADRVAEARNERSSSE